MLHAPPDRLAQRTQRNLLARLTIAQHSLQSEPKASHG
jgi:hypothetical protein